MIHRKAGMVLNVCDIIDGINAKKNAVGMTNQQVSDASGVPKSTVDRVLSKRTENPTMQVILDIAGAVGYEMGGASRPGSAEDCTDNPYVREIISMYKHQIADLKLQHNRVTAEKDRWIQTLAAILAIMGAGAVTILLLDMTNPEFGWIRHDTDPFALLVVAIGLIIAIGIALLRKKTKE